MKKRAKKSESLNKKIDRLAVTVERGFAAVAEDIGEIKRTMATKEDIFRIETRLVSIEQELKDIKHRLTKLEADVEKFGSRYKNDIEELWKHVAAIEKRLKIQR